MLSHANVTSRHYIASIEWVDHEYPTNANIPTGKAADIQAKYTKDDKTLRILYSFTCPVRPSAIAKLFTHDIVHVQKKTKIEAYTEWAKLAYDWEYTPEEVTEDAYDSDADIIQAIHYKNKLKRKLQGYEDARAQYNAVRLKLRRFKHQTGLGSPGTGSQSPRLSDHADHS